MSTAPGRELDSYGTNFVSKTHSDAYPAIDPPKKADLSGRSVLISGASKGIGRAIALAFAAAGASTLILAARSDLSSVTEEVTSTASKAGKPTPKVISLALDVTDQSSVAVGAAKIKSEIGHLDIIINNAGAAEKLVPLLDSEPDSWWNTWKVNIFGSYMILHAFLPLVIASPHANKTVIALSSHGAHITYPGLSGYQPGKLALLRLMEFINVEYGDKGVLAYSVHPGAIFTDMTKGFPEELHHRFTDTPGLAGGTIAFLASERREWLAGRYISCNWDMEEFLAKKDEIVAGDLLKVRMAVEALK